LAVDSLDSARAAAVRLLASGAGTVLVTLGERGVLAPQVDEKGAAGDRLTRRRQAWQRHRVVHVGRADYADARHTRSRKSRKKRGASTSRAARQVGAGPVRRGRLSATVMPRVRRPSHSTTTWRGSS